MKSSLISTIKIEKNEINNRFEFKLNFRIRLIL